MDEIVCVKTYNNIQEAEVARAVLEAEGIRAAVFRDDCGGWYPHYFPRQGHRLMVNRDDLARAGEILETLTTE